MHDKFESCLLSMILTKDKYDSYLSMKSIFLYDISKRINVESYLISMNTSIRGFFENK